MGDRIVCHCECCKKDWDLPKTNELPAHVWKLRCNFCIDCDIADRMTDYYEEWWDENENTLEQPIPVTDNHLCFPFLLQEIWINDIIVGKKYEYGNL